VQKTGKGIASSMGVKAPKQYTSVIWDCCLTGDMICQTTGGMTSHMKYGGKPASDAQAFIVGKLKAVKAGGSPGGAAGGNTNGKGSSPGGAAGGNTNGKGSGGDPRGGGMGSKPGGDMGAGKMGGLGGKLGGLGARSRAWHAASRGS
jgi:hypothetical protein